LSAAIVEYETTIVRLGSALKLPDDIIALAPCRKDNERPHVDADLTLGIALGIEPHRSNGAPQRPLRLRGGQVGRSKGDFGERSDDRLSQIVPPSSGVGGKPMRSKLARRIAFVYRLGR